MSPTLSIIIPCYNGEKYLADAVNSILKQPCQDLEIIIVDDGSMDASGAIADRFAAAHENIHVFHIPNSGVSVARNTGVDHAAGRYIGFLDADDVLCRDAYDREIHGALLSEQYDVLSFSYITGMENLRYGRMMPANHAGLYLRENKEYIRQTEKHFCSYLYSRALFTDTVRFPAGIRYNEDLCFLFLASRSARHIMQYEKPWFVYRMNSASVMYNLKKADYVLEAIDGLEICRKSCAEKKDISDCEGNIFACMVKYIRLACMYGTPVSEILKNVAENEPLQKVLVHYGTFWVNEQTAQLYDSFMKEPKKIWVKYRAKGILYIAVKHLIRTRPGEIINQKIRYKLALKDYLAE